MIESDRTTLRTHLQSIPYFSGLDTAALQKLARLATLREYPAGAIVFLEGETSAGLYIVQRGWVKVVKFSPEGREQAPRHFGSGEAFSEIGIFEERSNPATAVTLEASALWLLERRLVQPLLKANPELLLSLLGAMTDRVAYLVDMTAEFSLHTVEVRLARLLLDQASDDVLERPVWMTQAELATRLGTVPDVLSRVLRSLSDANLIRVDRRRIVILNRTELRNRAFAADTEN